MAVRARAPETDPQRPYGSRGCGHGRGRRSRGPQLACCPSCQRGEKFEGEVVGGGKGRGGEEKGREEGMDEGEGEGKGM